MPSPYRLDHIAIHARDMAASVRFYVDILGLREVENPMGRGFVRWIALDEGTNLHLVPGNTEALPERAISSHLALAAPNFDRVVERLTRDGVAFGDMPGRPGKITTRPDGVRQCFVQDPDNFWIEINDAKPRPPG